MARKSGRNDGNSAESPVTIKDVALKAGVSVMTVSRAIKRPELVNEVTREHVLEIVRSMGYVPNIMAGALATRKSRLVSILLPTIANSIYSIAVQSIINRLSAFGYQSLVGPTGYSPENEEILLDAILGRRPDGIVLTGTLHTAQIRSRLASLGIPVVEAWDLSDDLLDTQVGFSHEKVGVAVADHFHAKGYRRWAVVGIDDPRAMRRCRSLISRLHELNIGDVHQEIFATEATWEVGRAGLAKLLNDGMHPEIVFCSSDTVALGVLAEAASHGISVPDDLAVLGFGNITNGQFAYPALSTVSVNAQEMGYQVAEALLRRLDGVKGDNQIDTGFEIIERGST
ncbi:MULTISPECIES: LacI family DNA-binding transcriptional regulator [Pseudomonas]|uniref:GntR family transcriptional regulator n=1 Tax=Pseudomonas fulva TaxID=47880 RepID=A0A0D0IA10_9PSED|nr:MULTISPECIES: LacI family DNA-binding transcriptional regulator [Pseudomonas]KIP89702.1 GntR family transcriptional regulator [Pseudomonas fulva]